MKADFSGYATKAGLMCSDGRTIMSEAFAHQDKVKVPLVWQHGHSDPMNVLGHALLEARPDGIYAYGFFNETEQAKHARQLLEHGDINMLSIWANELVERSKRVFHGAIREVSLVLSGANPGALIENVTIRHSDGIEDVLDDEVIIYTGLSLEHASSDNKEDDVETKTDDKNSDDDDVDDEETLQDIYDSMTEKQQQVLHYMVAEAAAGTVSHALQDADPTFKEIYEGMTDQQKTVLHYMVGEAKEKASEKATEKADAKHSDIDIDDNDPKGNEMKHNVFETKNDDAPSAVLSHADIEGIVADATKVGSLKEAVESYALAHGIQDIDTLFPEARTLQDSPELFSRRTEWVQSVMSKVRKSPFSRIKTIGADLTVQEARAKGYIKGTLKKEEFFKVSKRVTTPTTIYKKQKLDRDDVIDITDFDVVTWLKGEMRLMLDEELARAILLGDGRDPSDEDKISEDNIRPVATDHEVYTTVITVNIDDASSSITEMLDHIVLNRQHLRGSGLPTMYTTETTIARIMLLKDSLGRKIYKNLDEVAAEIRVAEIVPVEVMEEETDIVAILVNLADYVVGADKGGSVSMFDDFDIDYNQYKYLIETRASGALVKMKSALVVKKTAAANVLVTPADPTFDGEAVTIVDTTGVVYRNADTDAVINAAGSPYAVAVDSTMNVVAEPAAGYYFPDSESDDWSFTNNG